MSTHSNARLIVLFSGLFCFVLKKNAQVDIAVLDHHKRRHSSQKISVPLLKVLSSLIFPV